MAATLDPQFLFLGKPYFSPDDPKKEFPCSVEIAYTQGVKERKCIKIECSYLPPSSNKAAKALEEAKSFFYINENSPTQDICKAYAIVPSVPQEEDSELSQFIHAFNQHKWPEPFPIPLSIKFSTFRLRKRSVRNISTIRPSDLKKLDPQLKTLAILSMYSQTGQEAEFNIDLKKRIFIVNYQPDGIGTVFFEEKLGDGLAKVVYRTVDPIHRKNLAAAKIDLESDDSDKPLALYAFREYIAFRTLYQNDRAKPNKIPGIIRVYGFDHVQINGKWYQLMYMELCCRDFLTLIQKWVTDGDSLLTCKSLIRMAAELAEGLDYIHSKKLLHRDIKLENLLTKYKKHWFAKFTDFGFSCFQDNIPKKELCGSPAYLSYELVLNVLKGYQVPAYSKASDIYAFGICLEGIFTGNMRLCCNLNQARLYHLGIEELAENDILFAYKKAESELEAAQKAYDTLLSDPKFDPDYRKKEREEAAKKIVLAEEAFNKITESNFSKRVDILREQKAAQARVNMCSVDERAKEEAALKEINEKLTLKEKRLKEECQEAEAALEAAQKAYDAIIIDSKPDVNFLKKERDEIDKYYKDLQIEVNMYRELRRRKQIRSSIRIDEILAAVDRYNLIKPKLYPQTIPGYTPPPPKPEDIRKLFEQELNNKKSTFSRLKRAKERYERTKDTLPCTTFLLNWCLKVNPAERPTANQIATFIKTNKKAITREIQANYNKK